ncbi:MAG: flagellar basal body rod protein FlgC [bacterium]
MSFFQGLKISASGLTAQRERMNVISSNLANINTTRTPEGGPYRKKVVIFEAQPQKMDFEQILKGAGAKKKTLCGVMVREVREADTPPRIVYDPNHPDADELGYLAMPNVNMIEEMVDMLSATRSYEANLTVIDDAKKMAMKAIEIGRS